MGDQLFEEWQVYEKLLIHDYMDHRAFFDRLQAEILSRFTHPVTILNLERWIKHAGTHYAELHDAEKKILFEHVRARDFPVSLAAFEALGKQAGLGRFEVLLQDHERLNCLVTFSAYTISSAAGSSRISFKQYCP